ncbi:hypothetical protein E4T50_13981 [Aureobasidium sp. EXF-12298]|nr:hypothetical protein E4T50_13981 [Aureobasidium sp. EXF-12298]KAI4753362.1 hypothetical protein E4T51_13498 [Aureobasidium sp. EXF-12344]KAI4774635.1 hypothetical protein E4T52_10388 [Aureobasidium sp. EXF-3400]
MQHPNHWGPELYYHPGYQLESHRDFDSGPWRSSVETEKQFWAGLTQPGFEAVTYPEFSGSVLSSSGFTSLDSADVKHEHNSIPDCKWSPTLTNSSLVSNTPSLPTTHSMPLTDSAVRMDGVESPTQWLASHQLHNTTDASGQHSSRRWYDTHAGVREDVLTQDWRRRRASIEQWPRHIQHSEAEVQALLDRPRRIKTTAENARFHCNECDKGFQRVYNLRSHMLKHEATREKIKCPHAGCNKSFDRKTDLSRHERSVHLHLREHKCVLCGSLFARKDTLVSVLTKIDNAGTSKAAAQNEQEWIANDSKIRWLQRSWTSMPTYADADL